ncbi:MAG: hypothetical protein K1X81_00970 [Bacteroidia bacterium]|nr:hypothetical protein [Bacteroidia bacterium]
MRKLILLSAPLLWLSAHAQKQLITTYNESRQEITLHYFIGNFEEEESKVSFNIGYLNAVPASNPYFSKGACRSMQLNTEGTFLYFFLTDRIPGNSKSGWTACFSFDIKNKMVSKLFPVAKQSYLIWKYLDERNSILYYDEISAAFIEKNLKSLSNDTLVKLQINKYESHLETTRDGILFHSISGGKICTWTYRFQGQKSEITYGAEAAHLCGARDKIITATPADDLSSVQLFGETKFFNKKIGPYLPYCCWNTEQSFCMATENQLTLYNDELIELSSFEAYKPSVLCSTGNGLIITYTDAGQKTVSWVNNHLLMEKIIPGIAYHTIYLITSLP